MGALVVVCRPVTFTDFFYWQEPRSTSSGIRACVCLVKMTFPHDHESGDNGSWCASIERWAVPEIIFVFLDWVVANCVGEFRTNNLCDGVICGGS